MGVHADPGRRRRSLEHDRGPPGSVEAGAVVVDARRAPRARSTAVSIRRRTAARRARRRGTRSPSIVGQTLRHCSASSRSQAADHRRRASRTPRRRSAKRSRAGRHVDGGDLGAPRGDPVAHRRHDDSWSCDLATIGKYTVYETAGRERCRTDPAKGRSDGRAAVQGRLPYGAGGRDQGSRGEERLVLPGLGQR